MDSQVAAALLEPADWDSIAAALERIPRAAVVEQTERPLVYFAEAGPVPLGSLLEPGGRAVLRERKVAAVWPFSLKFLVSLSARLRPLL